MPLHKDTHWQFVQLVPIYRENDTNQKLKKSMLFANA